MSKETLTRAGLAQAVYEDLGVSRQFAASLVDQIFEEIASALAEGEVVKIRNFGRFMLHEKRKRIGRNPKTQVEALIKARRVVSFRSSSTLKQRMNPSLQNH